MRGRSARWNLAALHPPRAHGAPLPIAEFKSTPEDFRVEEELSFAPSGEGSHWLLRVEKRGANTRWVAAQIARLGSAPIDDVGFGGLKDRQAVAVQWFSVPALGTGADYWNAIRTEEFRILEVHANARKLKRGALSGNRFRIRLRKTAWSRDELDLKLAALRQHGVPNYFGPQRFVREGYNLDQVALWIDSGRAPRSRAQRGFALSAARSLIFNAVLAHRVEAGDWANLEPGDLASLDGSGSHFSVSAIDDELQRRLHSFDVHPSGPLWGRGEPRTQGRPYECESAAAGEFRDVADLLAAERLDQERRSLRCPVRELAMDAEAGTISLSFRLGRGQFATAVLREICELGSVAALDFDEE